MIMIEASITLLFGAVITLINIGKLGAEKRIRSTQQCATDETASVKPLEAGIQKFHFEKEDLKRTLWKNERQPAKKFAVVFLFFGTVSLVLSIVFTSYILAFVGLGLTFWGVLFLFISPVTYVKSSLVDSTVAPLLITLDKMLTQLNYQGNVTYLPPRSLKGAKEGVLFIAAEKNSVLPSIEDVSPGKIFTNPNGICLAPLGHGLVDLFEEELGIDLFKTDFDFLQSNLPRLLIEDLELVKGFEMDINGDIVHVKMRGSVYSNVCSEVRKLTNICSRVGCPICSAIAQALAKATAKAVTIEKTQFYEDESIETWYHLFDISR